MKFEHVQRLFVAGNKNCGNFMVYTNDLLPTTNCYTVSPTLFKITNHIFVHITFQNHYKWPNDHQFYNIHSGNKVIKCDKPYYSICVLEIMEKIVQRVLTFLSRNSLLYIILAMFVISILFTFNFPVCLYLFSFKRQFEEMQISHFYHCVWSLGSVEYNTKFHLYLSVLFGVYS